MGAARGWARHGGEAAPRRRLCQPGARAHGHRQCPGRAARLDDAHDAPADLAQSRRPDPPPSSDRRRRGDWSAGGPCHARHNQSRAIANVDVLVRALHGSLAAGELARGRLHRFEDTHSAIDQCALFRAADLVVAPHGAALANLLCARPGTAVVELHAPRVAAGPAVLWRPRARGDLHGYHARPNGESRPRHPHLRLERVATSGSSRASRGARRPLTPESPATRYR